VVMLCMVPHATEVNRSLCSRNALQIHWCAASAKKVSPDDYFRRYPGFYSDVDNTGIAHADHEHQEPS
jgi:hypothetical protein